VRITLPQVPPFPNTPRGRFWQRLGHHANVAIALAIGASIPLGFFGGDVAGYISGVLTEIMLVAFVLYFRHDAGLCERCVASMPLNAPDRVKQPRARTMLRVRHAPLRVLLVVFVAAEVLFLWPLHGWHRGAAGALGDVILATYWVSLYVHRKVEPWCPWCHPRDDEGDEEFVPDGPPGNRLPAPVGPAVG
jgi:hypothetical protein